MIWQNCCSSVHIATCCSWFSSKDHPYVYCHARCISFIYFTSSLEQYWYQSWYWLSLLAQPPLLGRDIQPNRGNVLASLGAPRSRLTCRRNKITPKPDMWNIWDIPLKGTNSLKEDCSRIDCNYSKCKDQIICPPPFYINKRSPDFSSTCFVGLLKG